MTIDQAQSGNSQSVTKQMERYQEFRKRHSSGGSFTQAEAAEYRALHASLSQHDSLAGNRNTEQPDTTKPETLPAPYPPPPGLSFVDDFLSLYTDGILPSPTLTGVQSFVRPSQLSSVSGQALGVWISEPRQVKIHLQDGSQIEGVVSNLSQGEGHFDLNTQNASIERISMKAVNLIFVQRPAGAQAIKQPTQKVQVTLNNQRRISGASDDLSSGENFFSIVMNPGQGQFERIIVGRDSVLSVNKVTR